MTENNQIISIQELLKNRAMVFDQAAKVKLVRHIDSGGILDIDGQKVKDSLYNLYRYQKELFLRYQSEQNLKEGQKSVFDDVEYIVSFIGEENNTARFVGVFKVGDRQVSTHSKNRIIYSMEEVSGFELLKERIIINWGKSTLSWHQWYNNIKEVVRIDQGMDDNGIQPFVSYNDVVIGYSDLKAIVEKNDNIWKTKLEAVNCIYLIQDTLSGKQYVGSTYGKSGIWGRWKEYAQTIHGGNLKLKALIDNDPDYGRHFHWVILETLSILTTETEAIERESLYKRKFCTLKFGYNLN